MIFVKIVNLPSLEGLNFYNISIILVFHITLIIFLENSRFPALVASEAEERPAIFYKSKTLAALFYY